MTTPTAEPVHDHSITDRCHEGCPRWSFVNERGIPAANAVECFDCGIFTAEEHELEDYDECPNEPTEHGAMPRYVTAEPLGRSDDQGNFHHGIKMYVYDAEA